MKRLLVIFLGILLLVSPVKAYTVNTSLTELTNKILEVNDVEEQFNYSEKDLFGFIPTKSYYDSLEASMTDSGLDLSLTYHKKIIFDFNFKVVSHFKLQDERLINDGISLSFVTIPSFLEAGIKEKLASLPVDITSLPLDIIYGEEGSFYKVSKDGNNLVVDFERSHVEDSVYKEEVNSDLLVINNNEIRVSDFNHFVNNKYFREVLRDKHNISEIYLDGDKLYLRIFKGSYEVDYIIEGVFNFDNEITLDYYDIYLGDKRLSKDEIKEFMIDNNFKFSGFKDKLYFDTRVLEEFINKYTNVSVSVASITFENDEVIIKLKQK